MRGIEVLDHLDAGPAILGDLVDVGTFHKSEADVGMPQAIKGPALAFPIDLQPKLGQDRIELFMMIGWEHQVSWLGIPSPQDAAEGLDGTRHAFAKTGPTLAAYIDFEDPFAAVAVVDDLYVPDFDPF